MALIEEQTLAAVAATAAVVSPRARKIARKGTVYGLAGALKAGDVVVAAARGAARAGQSAMPGESEGKQPAPAAKRAAGGSRPTRSAKARSASRSPSGATRS